MLSSRFIDELAKEHEEVKGFVGSGKAHLQSADLSSVPRTSSAIPNVHKHAESCFIALATVHALHGAGSSDGLHGLYRQICMLNIGWAG